MPFNREEDVMMMYQNHPPRPREDLGMYIIQLAGRKRVTGVAKATCVSSRMMNITICSLEGGGLSKKDVAAAGEAAHGASYLVPPSKLT